jgi:hypothetical protein
MKRLGYLMNTEEHHEYLCSILVKLVPVLPCDELRDLASALGIKVEEFYGSKERKAA